MAQSDKIVMMEDHDRAYSAWKERGVRAKTLVHVDAHIDFGWIPEIDLDEIGLCGKDINVPTGDGLLINPFINTRKKMVHIGNYICPAIRDDIVKKFYWVVPDESWRNPRGFKHIEKNLRHVLNIKSRSGGKIERDGDSIRCHVLGREVVVCSLENLELINEPVLLDIDVDFMLTRHIWDDLDPERTPWISSEELFEKLSRKVANIEILTIAYSVEGGYTPLRFKYMGDELRSLYAGDLSGRSRAIMEIKKKALSYEREKNIEAAVGAYEDALNMDDSDSSFYFNLSILRSDAMPGNAREKDLSYLDEAIKRDKAYATTYNNYGILYMQYGKLEKAETEYKKLLNRHGDDSSVLNGLGYIALSGKRYIEAVEYFKRCLCLDGGHVDARRGVGVAYFKMSRLSEAEEILSRLKIDTPNDPEIYWYLGCIAEKRGAASQAIARYKDAVLRGGDGPLVHLRLLRLYLISGYYYRAIEEAKRSFEMIKAYYQ